MSDPLVTARDLERRAEAFRLLASFFCEPDPELLLAEQVPARLALALREDSPAAAAGVEAAGELLRDADPQALLAEYTRLFLGPFEIPAPPYASVYLETQKTLMGASTAAVQELYRSCGLELDQEAHELPDHIAVELEFLGYLAYQEAAATGAGAAAEAARCREQTRAFLEGHVLKWAPDLCARVENASTNGFYGAVARSLRAYLRDVAAGPSLPAAGATG
ncbi:MAG: TorD/DmsD family molecular chaperone [Deferrisomatales bacterium]